MSNNTVIKWSYEVVYTRRNKLACKVFHYTKPCKLYPLDLPEDVLKFTKGLTKRKVHWYAYLFKNPANNYCSHAYFEQK